MHYPPRLLDTFGRYATDLRLSVTDRCNLRCLYCLPEKVTGWLPKDTLLRPEEFRVLSHSAARLGVTKARITGGEPLLRPDLADIVRNVRQGFADAGVAPDIALTTNGIGLDRRLDELLDAGIERFNISIDSLDAQRFLRVARRDRADEVIRSLDALDQRKIPGVIKLNTVVLDWDSLRELPSLITFALHRGYQWRGIEFMPIGPLASSVAERPTSADIMRTLYEAFDLTEYETPDSQPARRWSVTATAEHPGGVIGLISSTSAPFCSSCTRTRLSADGKIYSCLFSDGSVDLLAPLRAGASADEIEALWMDAMWNKPAGHQFLAPLPSSYSMSKIGG